MKCTDCGKTLPKGRKAEICSVCLDLAADAAQMDSGEWVPNGRGSLVWMGGDAA